MRLLYATPSPFARKVRVALREKGLTFDEVLDNPWLQSAKAAQDNPLGKVPVLYLPDGRTLYDSRVILDFLDTLGGIALCPAEDAALMRMRQIEALADGICDALVLVVLEQARPENLQSADWIARQQGKIRTGIAAMAAMLGTGWLLGAFGRVDIAAGAMLGYVSLRWPEWDWQAEYPALAAYHDRLEQRPSFAASPVAVQQLAPLG